MRNRKPTLMEKQHPFYFALPATIVFFIFFILPILLGVYASFTDWNTFSSKIRFVGWENFKELFVGGRLLNSLKASILFTITVVVFENLIGFSLGLALHRQSRINELFRAVFFFPCVVAIVVWGFLFLTIMSTKGLLNEFLSAVAGTKVRIGWLASREYTIIVVGMVSVWIWSGFQMMIYVTSINAIPPELLEAARLDGVGFFRMIRDIIIPMIIPGMTMCIVLTIIGGLKAFDIVVVLTGGGPGRSTEVMNKYIFEMFSEGYFGFTAAANFLLIVFVSLIAFPVYIQLSKRAVQL